MSSPSRGVLVMDSADVRAPIVSSPVAPPKFRSDSYRFVRKAGGPNRKWRGEGGRQHTASVGGRSQAVSESSAYDKFMALSRRMAAAESAQETREARAH